MPARPAPRRARINVAERIPPRGRSRRFRLQDRRQSGALLAFHSSVKSYEGFIRPATLLATPESQYEFHDAPAFSPKAGDGLSRGCVVCVVRRRGSGSTSVSASTCRPFQSRRTMGADLCPNADPQKSSHSHKCQKVRAPRVFANSRESREVSPGLQVLIWSGCRDSNQWETFTFPKDFGPGWDDGPDVWRGTRSRTSGGRET